MAYNNFYKGGYSTLDPEGELRVSAAGLSLATDPRTANQIAEVSTRLNTGMKNIEVSTLTPDVFESIPEQHLSEIKRISELTGTKITVHGLLVEPSGISQQGFSEVQREGTERQMLMNIERASKMGGGVVTFHSTAGIPEAEEKVMVKDENGRLVEKTRAVTFIDPRTGRIRTERDIMEHYLPVDETEKFTGEKLKFQPEIEIKRVNEEGWRQALENLNWRVMRGNDAIREEGLLNNEIIKQVEKEGMDVLKKFGSDEKVAKDEYYQRKGGEQILQEAYREMRELFDTAYKKAKEEAEKNNNTEDFKRLKDFASEVSANIEKINNKSEDYDAAYLAKVVREGTNILGKVANPDFFVPLNDFVLEKSSQTFGDVAFKAYEKLGDKAPIVSIENPPAGSGFSRAEDLKKLIKESRNKFVENAMKEGYSKSEAEDASKKMIGATWDVGHINMLRKYGYTEKEIIKEAEKIAPYVKHVHLSDNFGMEHTELPMGMGNVPLKGHLEKLKKGGFTGKSVIETGNWWQHFKTPPVGDTLEALGSPIYSMKMAPYWSQARSVYGNYFSGYGPIFPEQHFSMYGGGFSSLPQELGGQIPGKQSRFSGTPSD